MPRSATLRRHRLALFAVAQLTAPTALQAQSSFDGTMTPARAWSAALDANAYAEPATHGGWLWVNPRVYRGLASDLEVGVGASLYSHRSGGHSALQSSLKWRAWHDSTRGLTVTTGGQWLAGLGAHGDVYGLAFTSVERALPRTRHTAGALALGRYWLVARDDQFADTRRGAVLSLWEAIGPVRLTVSWIGGRNQFGARVITVTYTMASSNFVGVGHFEGNARRHNAGPYVTAGRTF